MESEKKLLINQLIDQQNHLNELAIILKVNSLSQWFNKAKMSKKKLLDI